PDINRGGQILAICGTLTALCLVIVVLRTWVRARIIRQVGADDWTMIAAMTVLFVEMMIIIPQVQKGAGRHVQYIKPPSNIVVGLHLNFITQPLCLIALCLTKVSVGLFLLRLTPSRRFRLFIIGTIIFTILSATGNFLTVFFQCQPLAFTWGGTATGTCIPPANLKFAAFFNSSVSVLTDVVFALTPVPMLWKVQMNWRVKLAVGAILSLGIFAAVAAVVKITFLSQYGKHGDFLFDSSDLTIWTTVEICTAIIAACIPCLKPLFRSLFSDGSSAQQHYGSKYKGYIRNPDSHLTPKSAGTTVIQPQFEMYDRTNFSSNVKAGVPSTGSEESILPQKMSRSDGITKTTAVFVS
ncbi:integral membrane protein, partial [Coniochaeta sp. 2T2.1]